MEIPAAHPRRSILSIQVLRHLNLGNSERVTLKSPVEDELTVREDKRFSPEIKAEFIDEKAQAPVPL
jgi:hypothetical protein